jgi:hypothetical protein
MYKQMIPADVVAGEAQSGGPADKVNEFVPSHEVAAAQMRYDKNATCDRCGNFGAFDLGGRLLCAVCYEEAGACCPEFGADDLWRDRVKV